MGATIGPTPACSVCTWVWVTLNGVSTLTSGAVVAVDPLTATLPVAPVSVHSGVVPLGGIDVGHGLAGAVTDDDTLSTELADDVSVFEPHAASIMVSDVAQAAMTTDFETRDEFTVRHATADRGHGITSAGSAWSGVCSGQIRLIQPT